MTDLVVARDFYQESLLEEYDKFRQHLIKMDITIHRQDWQPMVMLEKPATFDKKRLDKLFRRLGEYRDLNTNCTVEYIKYDAYINDARYLSQSFAQIIMHSKNPPLIVFFPRSYNTGSLTLELNTLDQKPFLMPDEVREAIIKQVQNIFKRYWPEYYMKFIPYGSLLSGLGFPRSSLNICIELDEPDLHRLVGSENPIKDDLGQPFCSTTTTNIFRRNGAEKFSHDPTIDAIKFKLEEYSVEYNFNKEIYTESTNLINHYLTSDPRVKPFLYALKIFGRGRNIFAAQVVNGIRYYGYTIMALAYLSQLDPPIIPNLQHINQLDNNDDCYVDTCRSKRKYWDTVYHQRDMIGTAARYHDCVHYDPSQPRTIYYAEQNKTTGDLYWNSSNNATVGELFMDFLQYYGYRFDYDLYAVSLKFEGKIAKKSEWRKDKIAIEDPFIAQVNLGASVRELGKLRDVFRGSFSILHSGISFTTLHKKVADITQYDAPRGIKNNRPLYVSLKNWEPVNATSKSFVLIGLPKTDDLNCYCNRIRNLFASHGSITQMLDLDDTTKQVFFTADTGNAKNIVLPFSFTLDGQTVHLVELYDYTAVPVMSL